MSPFNGVGSFIKDKELVCKWYRSSVFGTHKHETLRKRFEVINSMVGSVSTENILRLSISYQVDNLLPRGVVQPRAAGAFNPDEGGKVLVSIDPGRVNIAFHVTYKNGEYVKKNGTVTLYHETSIMKKLESPKPKNGKRDGANL